LPHLRMFKLPENTSEVNVFSHKQPSILYPEERDSWSIVRGFSVEL